MPEVINAGIDDEGRNFFIERSVGDDSLHDQALADVDAYGHVSALPTLRSATVAPAALTL